MTKIHRRPRRCGGKRGVILGLVLVVSALRLWLGGRPSLDDTASNPPASLLGAIVLLAPPRRTVSDLWYNIDRFCLLLRAVQSVDTHLNAHYGPYPIFIVVAGDYAQDPRGMDDEYTSRDLRILQRAAPHSEITLIPVKLYSGEALEPGTTQAQILEWRAGRQGGVEGRNLGYQSMCRLWSGRLQQQSFLDPFTYYLRMDDDSLFTEKLPFDPFLQMKEKDLTYAYRSHAWDHWGIEQLWKVSKPRLLQANVDLSSQPFLSDGEYTGQQPYNNFHVSRIDFWRSPRWRRLQKDYDQHHLFFQYRVGDANVHAMALMLMQQNQIAIWDQLPYVHNSNDDPGWVSKVPTWKEECQRAYDNELVP